MSNIYLQLLSIFVLTIFLAGILMHIVKRSSSLILIYLLQSLAVTAMLFCLGLYQSSLSLIYVSILTFLVKIIGATLLFSKIIDKKKLSAPTTTYLNTPITLGIILGLTILVKSSIFAPIVSLFPSFSQLIAFSLSGILISLFLIINRRGVFSQLIGILSSENGLIAFASIAGIEQILTVEIGILFNILLWIVISSVLVTLIYRHFGSLNTTEMIKLKD